MWRMVLKLKYMWYVLGLVGILGAVFQVHPIAAQPSGVAVEASVSYRSVTLGEAIQLTVTVQGTQNTQPVELPKIEGLDVRYLGPSRRVSIVNGQYTSSVSYVYSILPLKEGTFQIPALEVKVDNQVYRTDPIDIQTLPSNTNNPVPSSSGGPLTSGRQTPESLNDKIFMKVNVPKTDVYVNERLPVKVLLFITDLAVQDIQYPNLEQLGFIMEDFKKPKQYQQVIKGVRYTVVEFDTYIYPTRTGELSLGPVTLDCNIVVQSTQSRRRNNSPFDSFFGDDFFDSFFDRAERRPLSVSSDPLTIHVNPLPEDGRPENFSGAVGQFEFDMSVSPTQVKEGDPLTLRMKITGNGNLNAIKFPEFLDETFKKYDPVVKEEGRSKLLEQVIIPTDTSLHEVPAVEFVYYDPDLKKYQTIRKGPIGITVTPNTQNGQMQVVNFDKPLPTVTPQAKPEIFGEDIVFIKNDMGRLYVVGQRFYKSWMFYVLLAFYVIGWMGGLMYYRWTYRLATDHKFARRLLAPKNARKGLEQAKQFLERNKSQDFYNCLFRTLQDYLGHKLHMAVGAVTMDNVSQNESIVDKAQTVLPELKAALEEFEQIRYASAQPESSVMQKSFKRVERIIDQLERHLR